MSAEIFRDPTEGVTARRADLLRRRRDELVMMPHAIRRVYVARRARTAASFAVAFVGIAMLIIAAKPAWTAVLAKGLPGINPAVLCTLTIAMWLVGLFTYFAARAVDEHRFAVAMSKLVMPGKDVNEDVERLSHENPDQAARDMAHRLEVRSSALPVLAAGVLLPVTALYVAAIYRAGGWPVIADFEASVGAHARKLLLCGGVGAALALFMTKRTARLPIGAPLALGGGIAASALALATSLWLVPVGLILAACAVVIRRLRIERDLLQAEDPAAGSEIWTIRGFLKQMRATGAAAIARLRKVRRRNFLIVNGAIASIIVGTVLLIPAKPTKVAAAKATATTQISTTVTPTVTPTGSKAMVESIGNGKLRITLDIVDDNPVDIPALAGMRNVPPMWTAKLRFEQTEGTTVQVSAFGDAEAHAVSITDTTVVMKSNCSIGEQPMGVRVTADPGHYVLFVEPTLTPAGC